MNHSFANETDLIICTACNVTKPRTDFKGKKGQCRNRVCRACAKCKEEKIKQINKERYRNDPMVAQAAKDRANQYYEANKEKCKADVRAYAKTPEAVVKRNQRAKKKRTESIHVRVNSVLRTSVYRALKGRPKRDRFKLLIGCSVEELFRHIESLWVPGMSWDNWAPYSPYRETWHIDHDIPSSVFDLSKVEEQRKCFNWRNLKPIWAIDNIRKGNYVPDYQI